MYFKCKISNRNDDHYNAFFPIFEFIDLLCLVFENSGRKLDANILTTKPNNNTEILLEEKLKALKYC